MPMKILGIDPGATGAFALIDNNDLSHVQVIDMPVIIVKGKRQVRQISEDMIMHIMQRLHPHIAYIERAHSMPRQGVASMFNYGVAWGLVRGVLAGLQIPRAYVTPAEWKRKYGLGNDKQESRLAASRLFPACVGHFARRRDDGRAEAALLALYGATQVRLDARPDVVQN